MRNFQYVIILLALVFAVSVRAPAQAAKTTDENLTPAAVNIDGLRKGVELYSAGKWDLALTALKLFEAQCGDRRLRAEARFWEAMAELQNEQYAAAVRDFDAVLSLDIDSPRFNEIKYQKGRALFYLQRYSDALILFNEYARSLGKVDRDTDVKAYNQKAAAVFWAAECLYQTGDYDGAEKLYNSIVRDFRYSYKYQNAVYRLEMLKQKRVEQGLLDIIRRDSAALDVENSASSGKKRASP
jgi:tetratricopeptide (TPR) repeat protein